MPEATSIYYDGLVALSRPVALVASAGSLSIRDAGDGSELAKWPVGELRTLGRRATNAEVAIVWRKAPDARLIVRDPQHRRALAALAPGLKRLAEEPRRPIAQVAWLAPSLVAAAVALVAAAIEAPRVVAPLVPHTVQASIGEEVYAGLLEEKQLCEGAEGSEALRTLAERLFAQSDYRRPWRVQVVRGGPVNAFALPGGTIVFFDDLIQRASGPHEVAGVLAHEIGHVVGHHSMRAVLRELGIGWVIGVLTGGYSDAVGLATGGAKMLLTLRHSRDAEREADAIALVLLDKAGMRADGVAGFFGRLLEEEQKRTDRSGADQAREAGLLSTHPPTDERVAATRRDSRGAEPMTATEWAALRRICGAAAPPKPPPVRLQR